MAADARRLRRGQNQGPRGPRGRPQASGDVHRLDRRRPACTTSSTRSSTTRLTKRWRASAIRSTSRSTSTTPSRSSTTAAAFPVDRHSSGRSAAEVVADRPPRRRQVRQRQLQGLGRSARRRRLGRQRAVGDARSRDLAQRPGLQADATSAAHPHGRSRSHRHDEEARHQDHVQAGRRRSSRRPNSASTRWRSGCASWRS